MSYQPMETSRRDTVKIKCWDFMKCGHDKTAGCPAVIQSAGRSCWLVAGTLCGGKPQGTFAKMLASCMECEFFMKIKNKVI